MEQCERNAVHDKFKGGVDARRFFQEQCNERHWNHSRVCHLSVARGYPCTRPIGSLTDARCVLAFV